MIINYCLGFAFYKDMVILIRKAKPEGQACKLNGIGGKLLTDEKPEVGMVREFLEETGIKTLTNDWVRFNDLVEIYDTNDSRVHCFYNTNITDAQMRVMLTEHNGETIELTFINSLTGLYRRNELVVHCYELVTDSLRLIKIKPEMSFYSNHQC